MKVRFDFDFDRGAWPGPLSEREAVFGEDRPGPLDLLNQLETGMGL